jgi:oligoribonuclease (3'-5' exoribonuclease)
MKYLSLDIETGGLTTDCSVLEAAFVEADTEDHTTPMEELPQQAFVCAPDILHITPYCLTMHSNNGLLADVERIGLPEQDFWDRIREYLEDYRVRHSLRSITPAGKNVQGFDLKFFPAAIQSMFSHRALDPGSAFPYLWGRDQPLSLQALKAYLGLGTQSVHRALEDARDVVRVLRCAR